MTLPGSPHVAYRGGELFVEDCALGRLARRFGTPLYVYSRSAMLAALAGYQRALAGRDHLICYAMKANSNLAVLQIFAQAGCGFDIVSGGELERVLQHRRHLAGRPGQQQHRAIAGRNPQPRSRAARVDEVIGRQFAQADRPYRQAVVTEPFAEPVEQLLRSRIRLDTAGEGDQMHERRLRARRALVPALAASVTSPFYAQKASKI
mgnify:CR=1 FL=1